MTLDPSALSLLHASAHAEPRFERLFDLTVCARITRQVARSLTRNLVKRGLWAVTGREEATRYVIMPDGQKVLAAIAAESPFDIVGAP